MLQAIVKKGRVIGEEVPVPVVSPGSVLIKVVNSCISAGTEMSGVYTSGQSLIKRAMAQPEKVKKVINMLRSDGIAAAYKNVMGELERGGQTGYSLSGIVIGVGAGVDDFKVGDKVAAAGGGLANHAEFVDVPENLVVKIPGDLSFSSASSVAIGAIAMHGVRRASLQFGEFAVVFGAGILGLIAVQLLRLSGTRVAVIDLDQNRLNIAKSLGAEICIDANDSDPVNTVKHWANGQGADAVIFTAATGSNVPLAQSFQMSKRKGKVILVGVSGMHIERKDIYTKELDLFVSTSYGPGRYDKSYEEKGQDYPYAYVRWTERRNMAEYLRLIETTQINLVPLISEIYTIERVTDAFNSLKNTETKPLMVLLDYGSPDPEQLAAYAGQKRSLKVKVNAVSATDRINVAVVGAGNFAMSSHLPNIQSQAKMFNLHTICDGNSYQAKYAAERFGAENATTEINDVLTEPQINLVMICTRHDSHAGLVLQALQAGKNVFVEKPLATNLAELEKIQKFYADLRDSYPLLMVGFNRRFSPYAVEIKKHTDKRINPLFIHYRMNAGYVPLDHWIHENGGRIIGEGCHIIDLMTFLTDSRIIEYTSENLTPATGSISPVDNRSIILKYEDGSVATIEYFAVGNKELPKEYMEIHYDQKSIIMEDYKSLIGHGIKVKNISSDKSEKGHKDELTPLYYALKEGAEWPIPLDDLLETTEVSIRLSE
ncbi:MAG: oxidoreductase [Calditrichales bacterium]|nr:MAG: oxidoreductase [Calditrichales bacterium]